MTWRSSESSAPSGSSIRNALGCAHDGAAERDALPVAGGKTRHRAVEQMLDPQRARRLRDAPRPLRARHALRFQRKGDVLRARSYADRARRTETRRRCRARAARLKVTSSPSSRMRPEVGSSSPAIMRSVVVLPQPEGPSRQKNSPSSTTKSELLHGDEVAEGLVQFVDLDPRHRRASARKLETTTNIERAGQDRDEGIGVERQPERLAQHDDAEPRSARSRRSPRGRGGTPGQRVASRSAHRSSAHRPEGDAAQQMLAQQRR